MVNIPDTTYYKADLDKILSDTNHLNDYKKKLILSIMNEYEDIWSKIGTLGHWHYIYIMIPTQTQ